MTVRNYFSTVFDGMAKGLFASLIVGVIIKQIGEMSGITMLVTIGQTAQYLMGACIGAGVAYVRVAGQFTMFASAVTGMIGAGAISATATDTSAIVYSIAVGEPVGAFVAALIGVEIGKLIESRTKFALLIVPAGVIIAGGLVGLFISPYIAAFLKEIGTLVNELTLLQPLAMGVLLGLIIGMILTSPISSAALCIAININGIAAGAALAGCCAQMIGFAVTSFRENKFSGLLSQGIGTSMLQMPNIIKNPWIWLPPTVASAVCGGLSTFLFKIETTSVGAGMGTAGLVGQFATYAVMGSASLLPMLILHFIVPIIISVLVSELMRNKSLIKLGDMQL